MLQFPLDLLFVQRYTFFCICANYFPILHDYLRISLKITTFVGEKAFELNVANKKLEYRFDEGACNATCSDATCLVNVGLR
jgi:hypothetical protein